MTPSLRNRLDLRRKIRIGGVEVPARILLAIPGVLLWLLIAVALTGFDNTVAALAANMIFVGGLFLLASFTRTIPVLTVGRAFLLGATAMALMLLLAQPLESLSRDPSATVDPIAEELLKLGPLALLLWQGRRSRNWQLGATDILLIAAAAGAGFAVVEDAYIRMNEGWGDTVPFLPTTEIYGDRIRGDRLIAGHAIWTALSGVTIGLAWLMARYRPALAVAPLGFLIATVDHLGVNGGTMPVMGPIVILLFLAGVAGVIALDTRVLRQKLPPVPELVAALSRPAPVRKRWRRILESRRLRFAAWRVARRPESSDTGAKRAVRQSVTELVDRAAI